MCVPAYIYAILGLFVFFFSFIKNWSTLIILSFAEIAWVLLCLFLSTLIQETNDLIFMFWILTFIVFSSIELAMAAVSFLINVHFINSQFVQSDPGQKK